MVSPNRLIEGLGFELVDSADEWIWEALSSTEEYHIDGFLIWWSYWEVMKTR